MSQWGSAKARRVLAALFDAIRKRQDRSEGEHRLQTDRKEQNETHVSQWNPLRGDDGGCRHLCTRNPGEQRPLAGGDCEAWWRSLVPG